MRWFTDAAFESDEAGWQDTLLRYERHIAQLVDRLPADLRTLATDPHMNLHDAVISRLVFDRRRRRVELTAHLDKTQTVVEFEEAELYPADLRATSFAVGAKYQSSRWGNTTTRIRAQEIDIAEPAKYVVRLKLWPFHEFAIEFSQISLRRSQGRDMATDAPGEFVLV